MCKRLLQHPVKWTWIRLPAEQIFWKLLCIQLEVARVNWKWQLCAKGNLQGSLKVASAQCSQGGIRERCCWGPEQVVLSSLPLGAFSPKLQTLCSTPNPRAMWWKLEIAAINNPHLPSGTVNGAVARLGAEEILLKILLWIFKEEEKERRSHNYLAASCTGCTLCNPCTSVPVPLVYGIMWGHQSSPAPHGHHLHPAWLPRGG